MTRIKKISNSVKVTLAILVGLIIFVTIPPILSNKDLWKPYSVPPNIPPSPSYPFGTTTLGQDLLWLTIIGLRNSLFIGILSAILAVSIAFTIGSIAGFLRGTLQSILTMFIDSVLLIPILPVLVVVAFSWKKFLTPITMSLVLSLITWPTCARMVRSMVLSLKERMFTYTSILSGMSMFKIFLFDYLPYFARWLVISILELMLSTIGFEVTLAVFGVGSLDQPSIGSIIFFARMYNAILNGVWWWIFIPLAIFIITIINIYVLSHSLGKLIGVR